MANISSLVANIRAALRVASRWAPASHLHDCPAWALVSFCCWRQSSDCVMGASSPTLDTLGSFRCALSGAGHEGEAGQETSGQHPHWGDSWE